MTGLPFFDLARAREIYPFPINPPTEVVADVAEPASKRHTPAEPPPSGDVGDNLGWWISDALRRRYERGAR